MKKNYSALISLGVGEKGSPYGLHLYMSATAVGSVQDPKVLTSFLTTNHGSLSRPPRKAGFGVPFAGAGSAIQGVTEPETRKL